MKKSPKSGEVDRQIFPSPKSGEVDRHFSLSYFRREDLPSVQISLYYETKTSFPLTGDLSNVTEWQIFFFIFFNEHRNKDYMHGNFLKKFVLSHFFIDFDPLF